LEDLFLKFYFPFSDKNLQNNLEILV